MLTIPVRHLGDSERGAVLRMLDTEPYAAAPVTERVEAYGLGRWRLDGRIFGYGSRRHLESLCFLGPHLTPIRAAGSALTAFAEQFATEQRSCSSLVGRADAVLTLWHLLAGHWGPARDVRPCQPLLVTRALPGPAPDPRTRLVRPDEVDLLFPAAVRMYTEEVGVSPLLEDGGRGYRQRVAELVRGGRAYAIVVGREVVFKAEVAVVTRQTAQIQGVWVDPRWRQRGVATSAMSAVVADVLRRVAPSVSLYVNDFNTAARRVYARCGFRQVDELATVLF